MYVWVKGLGEACHDLRKATGWSRRKLCLEMGDEISEATLCRWEAKRECVRTFPFFATRFAEVYHRELGKKPGLKMYEKKPTEKLRNGK